MERRASVVAVILLCAGSLAAGWASAQAIQPRPVVPPLTITSGDIAFRVESRIGNTVTGRLLVRIDGEWIEADTSGGPAVRRLDSK